MTALWLSSSHQRNTQRLGELAAENELLREANRRMAGDDGLPAFLKDHTTREQCCP